MKLLMVVVFMGVGVHLSGKWLTKHTEILIYRVMEKNSGLELIKNYFLGRAKRKTDIGLFEFQIDGGRFDCMVFHGHKQKIKGFEFKLSREDFLNEIKTQKFKRYLGYCHNFSFVCPWGLIKKDEVPPKVGLLWITTANEYYGYNKNPGSPHAIWMKSPKFLGEIPNDIFRRIVLTLINRVKYRKDDFF